MVLGDVVKQSLSKNKNPSDKVSKGFKAKGSKISDYTKRPVAERLPDDDGLQTTRRRPQTDPR